MNKTELINYWVYGSDMDFKAMQNMFKSKDYHWALFVGHLVIAKFCANLFSIKLFIKNFYTLFYST